MPEDGGFRIEGTTRSYILRPWIGPQFKDEWLRIMVHGDSYYATDGSNSIEAWQKDDNIEAATEKQIADVIEAYASGAEDSNSCNLRNAQLYQGVVKAISGKCPITSVDVKSVFGRIAFNNYVHIPMQSGSSVPTMEQYKVAAGVYADELARLKPHLSLVFARRVWNNLPSGGERFTSNCTRDMWLYEVPAGKVLVGWLRHPSTIWRRNGWRDETELQIAQEYIRAAAGFHRVTP